MRNIVFKMGGSILFREDGCVDAIRRALQAGDKERIFAIVGGGEAIESMRALHAIYSSLNPVAMHWRCIRLLDATWEVACELFPDFVPVSSWEELMSASQSPQSGVFLVRPAAFYSDEHLARIPRAWWPVTNWETTSDALSWLLAKLISATEIRLAKRCACDSKWSVRDAAEIGIIDKELYRLASMDENPIPIFFVQL